MLDQDSTRVRLLLAAGKEFADKGFELARIRTICENAEANVAAVNYHFGDKERLYVEAVVYAHQCGQEESRGEHSDCDDPPRALRMFIHQFLKSVLAIDNPDDWRHRLMLREMLDPTEASEVLIRESIQPRFEMLKRIMRCLCPEADERRLSALCFSVIGQCLHYKMARRFTEKLIGRDKLKDLDLEYLTDHISSICLAALGVIPPLGGGGDRVGEESLSASAD